MNGPGKLKQKIVEACVRPRFKHRAITLDGLEDTTPNHSEADGDS